MALLLPLLLAAAASEGCASKDAPRPAATTTGKNLQQTPAPRAVEVEPAAVELDVDADREAPQVHANAGAYGDPDLPLKARITRLRGTTADLMSFLELSIEARLREGSASDALISDAAAMKAELRLVRERLETLDEQLKTRSDADELEAHQVMTDLEKRAGRVKERARLAFEGAREPTE